MSAPKRNFGARTGIARSARARSFVDTLVIWLYLLRQLA
jgi:hypothetical protein